MSLPSDFDLDAFYATINWQPHSQSGDEDIGYCPFPANHTHGDTTGKFALNREKLVWNCWICGGGDLASLVMKLQGTNRADAEAWMRRFGRETHWEGVRNELDQLWEAKSVEKFSPPFFSISRLEEWGASHPWFDERHIPPKVVDEWNLRYAHDAILGNYEGPAIVLPHFWQNQLVGWQYRWLYAPEHIPKYSFTKSFPRQETLYGWHHLQGDGPIIVVESIPTVLRLVGLGYSAVATFGANVSSEQIKLLRSLQAGVVIAPDNDKAGKKFTRTLTKELDRFIPLWRVRPPDTEGADLADFKDDSSIIECLERRQSIYVYEESQG